ncbi:hypothetical protein SUGI_0194800 [Cryptomeria japonica]|nr:hypothetical protein SUGI_0194800 [Cryptomeria japonica]
MPIILPNWEILDWQSFWVQISVVLTATRGMRGYLVPKWISVLSITPKVDVYSFGMTLLKIISGLRNLDLGCNGESARENDEYRAAAFLQQAPFIYTFQCCQSE